MIREFTSLAEIEPSQDMRRALMTESTLCQSPLDGIASGKRSTVPSRVAINLMVTVTW